MRLNTLALVLCLPLAAALPALAGEKRVTCYLDGSRVEQQVAARDGYLEYELPEAMTPGSFRVQPAAGGTIERVELSPADREPRRARQIARLEERRSELKDRLQALERREEIFAAAAKSQSGKGVKKTKSNPEPLVSLKQGTEFALSQLEAVYRGKRSCRAALDALEQELAAARKAGSLARIWLKGGRGRASLSYVSGEGRWTPRYAFRFPESAAGELFLHALLPRREKGVRYLVANGSIAQKPEATGVTGDFPVIVRRPLTLRGPAGTEPPLSFTFDAVEAGLPAGEAAVYWRGEYLGSGRFAGGGASEFSLAR